MSNQPTKQARLDIFFSARKQIVSARVENDFEVLQLPSTPNTALESFPKITKNNLLGNTIDLR